jgi:hypothetical protein
MKGKSEQQKKHDHTLLAADVLVVAGLLTLSPPWIRLGM